MSANEVKSANVLEEKTLSNDKIYSIHIPEDGENRQKSTGRNVSSLPATRNPLSDLCENIPGKRITSTRKVQKSNTVVEVKKVKPTGTNDKQTKIRYSKKFENVTERQNAEEAVKTLDEVFVEGENHYLNYLPQNQVLDVCFPTNRAKSEDIEGEINKPLPLIRISGPGSDRAEVKKPSQKVTLVRKLSTRRKRLKEADLFSDPLYDEDYFKDNYAYVLETERKFVFRKDMMRRYINEDYRRVVVDWLVYVQQILGFAEATLFVGVRIFDCVLLSSKCSCRKYILVGITSLWIASKDLDVQYIQVPKLFSLCNGKYSKQEFLSTEKEILRHLRFNVNFPEPATFLFYYLDHGNLQNDSKIRNSAMFLLELFALLLDFSSLTPSILAALALHLVLVKNELDSAPFLDFIDDHLLDKETFLKKSREFGAYVEQLLVHKVASKEIVEKYSKENKFCVAKYFLPE